MNPRDQLGLGLGSLEELRVMTGVERPASVKEMLARYREPVVFDEALNTPDGVALGGHQTITGRQHGRLPLRRRRPEPVRLQPRAEGEHRRRVVRRLRAAAERIRPGRRKRPEPYWRYIRDDIRRRVP
jgi:hypothetical protein